MDLGLRNTRCFVLGSSSGLGRAVSETLIEEGAAVVVMSRDEGRAAETCRQLGATGYVVGDLSADGVPAKLVNEAAAVLGGLDVCVVNTGGGVPGGILQSAGADDAAFRSMLRPALEVARASAPLLAEGGRGRLLFLTARSVVEASPELALSSVFRTGVMAAARSLAIELAPRVLVNVIVTGQFDTPALDWFEASRAEREARSVTEIREEHVGAIPVGRVGTPRELADVVAFLASTRASFVTGTTIRIDGGAVRGF